MDDYPRPVYIHPTVTTQTPLTSNEIQKSSSINSYSSPMKSLTSSSSSSSSSYSKSNAQKNSFYTAPSHTSYSYNPPSAPAYSVQTVASYSPSASSSYGYPHSVYGTPQPMYGVPSSMQYPPSMHQSSMSMAAPMAEQKGHGEWFLAKLMKKFDLILMSKILLKLIIFKKIVKFIGIICLLMFLPILKKKFEDHIDSGEDEVRRIKPLDDYGEKYL
jgi:hypothetical protein